MRHPASSGWVPERWYRFGEVLLSECSAKESAKACEHSYFVSSSVRIANAQASLSLSVTSQAAPTFFLGFLNGIFVDSLAHSGLNKGRNDLEKTVRACLKDLSRVLDKMWSPARDLQIRVRGFYGGSDALLFPPRKLLTPPRKFAFFGVPAREFGSLIPSTCFARSASSAPQTWAGRARDFESARARKLKFCTSPPQKYCFILIAS
ncbi:hypothetical protein B0H11DRAFT_1905867 [Mycena galericulata]|nr:hypothetical protein B0H11DRAFT_1905867 [Mycena galericulata]